MLQQHTRLADVESAPDFRSPRRAFLAEIREPASPVLEAALHAAISERIGEHVEQGTEHLARRYYGDREVDDWFRSQGWDPDEIRGEPLTPAAELLDAIDKLDAAIANREPDPAEQWKRFMDARIALGPDRVVCEHCRGRGHFGSDEEGQPVVCDECEGGSRPLPEVDRDFFRALS